MAKKTNRQMLRRYARVALEQRGFQVREKTGPGIVPGARLIVSKNGSPEQTVAVRTSHNRKVGLMRHPSGKWRTVPKVEHVVVAVHALGDPTCVEVLGFDPKKLTDAFDALVASVEKGKSKKNASKSPVFIALDPSSRGIRNEFEFNLKERAEAEWSLTLPINYESPEIRVDVKAGFIERVKREFAELNGVDVTKVTVNFHIVG